MDDGVLNAMVIKYRALFLCATTFLCMIVLQLQVKHLKKQIQKNIFLHSSFSSFCKVCVYLWREVAEHQPAAFPRAAVTPG